MNYTQDQIIEVLIAALLEVRETLLYVQAKAPGYDWNADPLYLTLRTGEAYHRIESALTMAGRKR